MCELAVSFFSPMTFCHLSSAQGLVAAVRLDSESKMDVVGVLLYSDAFPGRKINSADMFVLVQAFLQGWHIFQALLTLLWRSLHGSLDVQEELGAEQMDQVISDEDATLECS